MARKSTKTQTTDTVIEGTPLVTDFDELKEKKLIGIATTKVNVRTKASLDSKIKKILEENDEITINSSEPVNGFYSVSGGYVKMEYLTIKEA